MEEFADVSLERGVEPEGVVFEGLDRPDWGTAEELEAWDWLEQRGLKEFAVLDGLDVCSWVPRFKVI